MTLDNNLIRKISAFIFHYREALIHLMTWLFFYSMVNVNWNANWLDGKQHFGHISPISAILTPVFFYANALWWIPRYLRAGAWLRYIGIVVLALFLVEVLRIMLVTTLSPGSGGFMAGFAEQWWSRDNLAIGFPNSLVSALVMSFAYRFSRDWIVNNQEITLLRAEKTEAQLNALKSQIDPHFLFNNLNTLDDLIDRDQALAKDYVRKLAGLYRYLASNLEDNVVSLHDEWQFIKDYIFLLETRFGDSYQFQLDNQLGDLKLYLIPTAALQVLVENVVKHNQGQPDDPLIIYLKIDQKSIKVEHRKRPKLAATKGLGTGLKNL
ncbi:MAG: sensor histidine kinase, partial [Bacteroidota bacterium]